MYKANIHLDELVVVYCSRSIYYNCQDKTLVAWLTQIPRISGLNPAVADSFPWCTHIVQIHRIMTTKKYN